MRRPRTIMKAVKKIMLAAGLCAVLALDGAAVRAAEVAPVAPQKVKNWTPPATKIRAQALSNEIMAKHPELVSVTFHGVPPSLHDVYTMFAGSFPDRIGNPDDQDDIDVITKGITVLDPKWHRSDARKKFGVSLPLRDAAGENIGLVTYAFKDEADSGKGEREFFLAAMTLRDSLQQRIPSFAALFEPAE
jgi:hypothetical protein